MKIKILYEDPSILVIDKPAGISVHPDGRNKPASTRGSLSTRGGEKTITDWVLKNYPKMENVGEPAFFEGVEIKRPGVVHRLDRQTSGVLILAKTQKAHEALKKQFQDRTIKKIYHTIVSGSVKNDKGIVDKPIGRSPSDFRRRLSGRGARGELREAITEYKVLKRFEEGKNKFTYLEVRPKTGRTHQIRVHMKYLNHPVVCDSLYNPGQPCPKGFDGLALHAKSIEFNLPAGKAGGLKGKTVKVESPLPKNFEAILK